MTIMMLQSAAKSSRSTGDGTALQLAAVRQPWWQHVWLAWASDEAPAGGKHGWPSSPMGYFIQGALSTTAALDARPRPNR